MLANLLAAPTLMVWPSRVELAFPDENVAELIGIDGVDEAPLALVHLGPQVAGLPSSDTLTPLTARAEPVARNVLRFPLVVEAQAGSSLRADEVAYLARGRGRVVRPAPGRVEPPAHADRTDRVEDVILRRGSTRVFRPEMAPLELLSWGLAAATTASSDTPPDGNPARALRQRAWHPRSRPRRVCLHG